MAVIEIIRQTMEQVEKEYIDSPGEYKSVVVIQKLKDLQSTDPELNYFLDNLKILHSLMTALVEASKGYYDLNATAAKQPLQPRTFYFTRRTGTANMMGG